MIFFTVEIYSRGGRFELLLSISNRKENTKSPPLHMNRPIGIKLEEDGCAALQSMNATLLLSKLVFKNIPEENFRPCPLSVCHFIII